MAKIMRFEDYKEMGKEIINGLIDNRVIIIDPQTQKKLIKIIEDSYPKFEEIRRAKDIPAYEFFSDKIQDFITKARDPITFQLTMKSLEHTRQLCAGDRKSPFC